VVSLLQHTASVATKTLADELYNPWKAEVVFLKDITASVGMQSENALWLRRDGATKCLQCNMADGVHQLGELI